MKKTLILMAAASAFVLTGCTESDLSGGTSLANGSSSAIEFSANTRNAGTTRAGYAGDLTNTTIKDENAGFGVFAYYSGSKDIKTWGNWDTAPTAITEAPNFMYNEGVTWSAGKNGWIYEPVKYWPNGKDTYNPDATPSNTATEKEAQYLSFFAYAPFVEHTANDYSHDAASSKVGSGSNDVPAGTAVYTITNPTEVQNGIVAMSKNSAENDMYVKYILNPAADANQKFVDLLWGLRGQNSYAQTSTTANDVNPLGTAYNTDLTKQIVGEKVKFLFKHALARVGGNTSKATSGSGKQVCGLWVVVDVDKNSSAAGAGQSDQTDFFAPDFNKAKTLVTIEEVKIRDNYSYHYETDPSTSEKSDFLTDGWFDIMNGTWSHTASATDHTTGGNGVIYSVTANNSGSPYKLNPAIKESGVDNASGADWNGTNANGATGVNLTKEPVYADDQDVPGLLLIPGETGDNTLYVTVRYRVRTADPNLSTGYTNVVQEITNKVTLANDNLDPNKYYNLVMHLGLTSVKFEAVVADWANGSDTYDEEGSEIAPGTGNDNSVWLPSNVVAYKVNQEELGTATSANIEIASYKIGDFVSGAVNTRIDINGDVTGTGTTATVNFDGANTTVTDKVNVITIVGDAGKVTVTLTHKAGVITMGTVSKSTDILAAGETVKISDVKAGGTPVTSAPAPAVTITATQVGGTYTTGLTGSITADGELSIVVPANTGFAATWTISKIKIGDAEYVPSPAITLGQLAPVAP